MISAISVSPDVVRRFSRELEKNPSSAARHTEPANPLPSSGAHLGHALDALDASKITENSWGALCFVICYRLATTVQLIVRTVAHVGLEIFRSDFVLVTFKSIAVLLSWPIGVS